MKKLIPNGIATLLFLFFLSNSFGQVGISESSSIPDDSAILDVVSSDKGLLTPRMTMDQRTSIIEPANALLVYQTNDVQGFYYNEGTAAAPMWKLISTGLGEDCQTRIPIEFVPYTISESGSYYLTQSISSSATNGITIESGAITIDLNGFTLTSDGSGAFSAIKTDVAVSQLNIQNGIIDNWGGNAIDCGNSDLITMINLQVNNSGYSGIVSGTNSNVTHCISNNNGFDGISAKSGSHISHCITSNNSSDGIDTESDCTITNCNSISNGDNGIEISSNCHLSRSTTNSNSGDGVNAGAGSTIADCISNANTGSGYDLGTGSTANQNQARSNTLNGFTFSSDASISNNSADNNALSGYMATGNDARIDNNQSTDNSQNGFQVSGTGNILMRNSTSGNLAVDFNIPGGNSVATILTSATLNTNTNPFANISF